MNVHVLPQEPGPEDEARGFKTLEFWDGSSWVSDVTLTFASAGTQSVMFRAAHDDAAEGKQFAIINHKVTSLVGGTTPGSYDGLAIRSVKVQINDDDEAGAIITRTERPLQVIEGNSDFDQTYAVVLTRAPTDSNTVDVTLESFFGQVSFSGATLIDGNTLHFTSSDYNDAQLVTVTPLDDSAKQGLHSDYISHTLTSSDVDTTETQTKYQLDGDPTVVGVNDIPAVAPLDTMLLADRPVDGTVQVWVDDVLRDADRFPCLRQHAGVPRPGPFDARTDHGQGGGCLPVCEGGLQRRRHRPAGRRHRRQRGADRGGHRERRLDRRGRGRRDRYGAVRADEAAGRRRHLDLDSFNTRSGALDPDTLENFAFFKQNVRVNGLLHTTLTFSANDGDANAWNKTQTVTVSAIDDAVVDGDEIQAFVPSVPTLNKIRGPLFLEGASGSRSLSLPAPLLLPVPQQEMNIHPSNGVVGFFTPSDQPGPGAIDRMVVDTADLLSVVASLADLTDLTLEMTQGPGTGIVLDPALPLNLYDRFWLILDAHDNGDGTTLLTLQNPEPGRHQRPRGHGAGPHVELRHHLALDQLLRRRGASRSTTCSCTTRAASPTRSAG